MKSPATAPTSSDARDDVIVNLCPTGMVPDRAMTPHVPLSPEEVIRDVTSCVALGANIVHIHARDESGRPHYSRDIYARQIAGIRAANPDVTICVSLSGRNFGELEQRADPLCLRGELRPDMGSLTLASLNFSGQASINAPDMVRRLAESMGERDIRPELEVFDVGMVNYAHYLISKGALRPPYYFNILLGNIASAQATPAQLAAIISALPEDSIWCLAGIGRQQLTSNTLGLLFGDGVRVGIEDNIWFDDARTRLATNCQLVERVLQLAATLGRRPATPGAVRARLGIHPLQR